MLEALRFPHDAKKSHDFAAYLTSVQFPYRLSEANGALILWVYEQDHIAIAQQLWAQFLAGERIHVPTVVKSAKRLLPLQSPIVLLLVLASLLGFLAVTFDHLSLMSWLSYQGFAVQTNQLNMSSYAQTIEQIASGQWWRLITPIFLHFDIMHVVFNVTILWFIAHQIERQQGHIFVLLLIVTLAVVSNAVQFLYSPDRLFGGMSGVNYGLLSYAFLAVKFDHRRAYDIPQGFFVFSTIMMVLGFFNVFSWFGYSIANWAHLAGFGAGICVFLCVFMIDKYTPTVFR